MKKTEIISVLAESTGLTKADVEKVYNATFELFKEELAKGNKISVSGFGTFDISERAEREGRNPQTGETIKIAASKSVKFKAGKELKEKVNN
ncbi:MAG: HU family DNA-binding protein [Erysipelotrichaceae bacterium]|nr:HU family DNA-binding protein [Erysipelotrichaceae bacterium]